MHRVVLLVGLVAVGALGIAAAPVRADSCAQQAAAKTAELRKQINELVQTKDEGGQYRSLGKCTIKALKLGLTFAAPGPTSEKMAKAEETADCLRLKIKELDTMCYCAQLGADTDQDLAPEQLPDRMDEADAAYEKMQKRADADLKKGIANPVIRDYVQLASRYKACYDKRSLALLKDISARIDAIDIAAGNDAGAGLPTVNVPTPNVGAPGVKPASPNVNEPAVNPATPNIRAPTVNAAAPATGAPAANVAAPNVNLAPPAPQAAAGGAPSGNCTDLRNDIAAMDAQSNAMPGYLGMRNQLAYLYNKLCGTSASQQTEYWYTSDGQQLGPVTGDRPPNAAYAATQDIGDQCAGTINPSMCALALGSTANCKTPPSDISGACQVAGGYGDWDDSVAATGAPPLPDAQLTVGGTTYDLSNACAKALARAGDGRSGSAVIKYCPDALLAALAKLEGVDPNDLTAFLRGLTPVLQKGFVPAGTPAKGGFDAAFCAQMQNNADICRQRENNMGTAYQAIGSGNTGQVGAFNDCYNLYSRFAGMCRMNVNMRPQIANASLPKPPAPPPQPKPAPSSASGASRPPPQTAAPAQPQMSPQCHQLVSNYVAAAQANNGPAALAGYKALKSAGGCGVLQHFDRPPPATAPAVADDLPSRGGTPLSDQVIGGCAEAADGCAGAVQQLQAGVSPEAQAALVMNAIQIGLEMGSAMASGMAAAAPHGGGGGGNMGSIGNRPVRSTYGQGAPTYRPAPPSGESTITGIGSH